MVRVAAVRLGEGVRDDLRDRLAHRCEQCLFLRLRSGVRFVWRSWERVAVGRTGRRGCHPEQPAGRGGMSATAASSAVRSRDLRRLRSGHRGQPLFRRGLRAGLRGPRGGVLQRFRQDRVVVDPSAAIGSFVPAWHGFGSWVEQMRRERVESPAEADGQLLGLPLAERGRSLGSDLRRRRRGREKAPLAAARAARFSTRPSRSARPPSSAPRPAGTGLLPAPAVGDPGGAHRPEDHHPGALRPHSAVTRTPPPAPAT